MSLSKPQVSEYRRLRDSGVSISKRNNICPNGGSETSRHLCLKALAAHAGLQNGYRVDSEVPISNTQAADGETDILLWGHDSRLTYSVEVETSITAGTKDAKIAKYVSETAIDDMLIINVTQAPTDMLDAYGFVATELGLDP